MQRGRVFGAGLQDFESVPRVFTDAISPLRSAKHLPGNLWTRDEPELAEKIVLIRRAYDHGLRPLSACRLHDMHAIAGALKLWLQSLPSPLIPASFYAQILQAVGLPQAQQSDALRKVLLQVGQLNLQVLIPLLELLHHTRLNQGGAGALEADEERTFAPAILRSRTCGSAAPVAKGGACDANALAAVRTLICNYRSIFSRSIFAVGGLPGGKTPEAAAAAAAAGAAGAAAPPPDPHRTALVGGMRVGTECPHRALGVAARLADSLAAQAAAAPAEAAAAAAAAPGAGAGEGQQDMDCCEEGEGATADPFALGQSREEEEKRSGAAQEESQQACLVEALLEDSVQRLLLAEKPQQQQAARTSSSSNSRSAAEAGGSGLTGLGLGQRGSESSSGSDWSTSSGEDSGSEGSSSEGAEKSGPRRQCKSPTSVLLDNSGWHGSPPKGWATQREVQLVPLSAPQRPGSVPEFEMHSPPRCAHVRVRRSYSD